MLWHVTINLKSGSILTVLNLLAINQIYCDAGSIDVTTDKFDRFQLPIIPQKLRFIGGSVITLPLDDIKQIKFGKK